MLSDCVISSLYMHVLKLTLKNLICVNFSQFSKVSVRSVRTVSIDIQTDKWSGREWSPIVRTGPECVQTRATCLLVPNAARVRTMLMYRPDGDPTEAIYTLDCRILSHTPHNLLFGIL